MDNSERGNIFAIEPRQLYTSSPTADRAARQGLGGSQGLAVLAGALGIVALVTLVGAAQPPDTLQVRVATQEGGGAPLLAACVLC